MDTQLTHDIAPPLLTAEEILRQQIRYCTVFRFIATFDIPPQTAANKQWRYIGGELYIYIYIYIYIR